MGLMKTPQICNCFRLWEIQEADEGGNEPSPLHAAPNSPIIGGGHGCADCVEDDTAAEGLLGRGQGLSSIEEAASREA
ncbi:unnamed protein product [Linum trigynum]|uniref:Uncharacterized protein n=1 Tax=Linum trigynum TaxID=586398 RepID=A0AAV2G8B5_9ROSI